MSVCKNCGTELEEGKNICGSCGEEQPFEKVNCLKKFIKLYFKKENRIAIITIAVIVTFLGGYLFGWIISRPKITTVINQGNKYLFQGKLDQAEKEYKKVIKMDKGNIKARINLAEIYKKQSKIEDAKKILEQGIEETGNNELKKVLEKLNKE